MEQIETGSFAPKEGLSHQPRSIRIVSWNIARGCQLDKIAKFLVDANADLVLLQEVDKHARRTANRNIAEHLAQKLKMNYVFGIEFQELGQGPRDAPAYHGQATLSRWPLDDSHVLRFRTQSTFWQPKLWMPPLPQFQRRLGGRMALLSHAAIGKIKLAIYNLHLESRRGDQLRRSQMAEVLNHTLRYGPLVSVVVAGDFNFELTEDCNPSLMAESVFQNPFANLRQRTTRSRSFGRSPVIDWILTRGPSTPTLPHVHDSVMASDHYPLSLSLEFPQTS